MLESFGVLTFMRIQMKKSTGLTLGLLLAAGLIGCGGGGGGGGDATSTSINGNVNSSQISTNSSVFSTSVILFLANGINFDRLKINLKESNSRC